MSLENNRSKYSGFSNQMALILLLIAFPVGLIGFGSVLILFWHNSKTEIVRGDASSEESAQADGSSVPNATSEVFPSKQYKPNLMQPSQQEPLANSVVRNPRSNRSTCWFQMQRGGDLKGFNCTILSRINVNGDRIFDVIEPSGLKRSVVLWENKTVEVVLDGNRYLGNWQLMLDNHNILVSLPGGDFAFTPNY